MYSQPAVRQWKVLKFRQLKAPDQEEKTDATLILDTSHKLICVYRSGREVERVSYDRRGKQYPKFKLKGMSLYVVMNSKFEGFRVTVCVETKEEFLSIMREYVEVSAGSQPSSVEKRADPKPRSESTPLQQPPEKHFATRHLSVNYFEPVHNPYAPSRNSCSQPAGITYTTPFQDGSLSQPVHNPYAASPPHGAYSQPAYNPYMVTPAMDFPPQQSTATSYAEDPFAIFDSYTSSPASSIPSSVGSIHSQPSPYSPHPYSQPEPFSSSPCHFSSQPSIPPPTSTPAPPALVDVSVQTDDLIDQLTTNSEFMVACLRNLMVNPTFGNLVASTRTAIEEMPKEDKKRLFKNTNPASQPIGPNSQPPSVIHHGNSDLECEGISAKQRRRS